MRAVAASCVGVGQSPILPVVPCPFFGGGPKAALILGHFGPKGARYNKQYRALNLFVPPPHGGTLTHHLQPIKIGYYYRAGPIMLVALVGSQFVVTKVGCHYEIGHHHASRISWYSIFY